MILLVEWIVDPTSPLFWALIITLISAAIIVLFRPLRTYVQFVYPNAKFEAMGNPYITEKELMRLTETTDITVFKDTMNASKDYHLQGTDVSSIQHSLDDHLIDALHMMKNDSSKKMHAFYNTYLTKYDNILIKNELKRKILGKPAENQEQKPILPTTQKHLQALHNATKETLPNLLKDLGYSTNLQNALQQAPPDFLSIDIEFDKHLIHQLQQVKVPYRCHDAKKRFTLCLLDNLNLKNILRAKNLGYPTETYKQFFLGEGKEIAQWKFNQLAETDTIPDIITHLEGTTYYPRLDAIKETYTTQHSTQPFEHILDQYFLTMIKDISLQYYTTLGPSLRFLISKEYEIHNLKVLVKAIHEHLPPDLIRQCILTEASP